MTNALRLKTLFLSLLGIASANLAAGQVVAERLNYKIVLPENPSKICALAGKELSAFMEKGHASPVKLNGGDAAITFFVGVSGEAIMAGFTSLPDMNGRFGVFRKDRHILFYGWDDAIIDPVKESYGEAGTLLAVYYFLNKYAKVGFYFPGENGCSVPKEQAIVFNADTDIAEPSFVLRGFSFATKEYQHADLALFFRRSLCSIPRWGHMDYYYIYMDNWRKRFWDTHPEYFMTRDGKRVSEKYPYHVPCFTNPDVIKQTAADIVEELNKNPAKTTVRIFCDAPIHLCDCDTCKASPERKHTGDGTEACEAVYGFLKKIADVVHQSHPDVFFLTQTKGTSYYQPPKLVNLGKLFAVEVLTRQDTCKIADQAFAVDVAKKWKEAGVRTFLKSYPRYNDIPTKNMPVITPNFTAEYFRAFKGLTSGAYLSELNFNPYSFSALNQFVQARLLYNVDSDVDALIKEFCAFAYPGAASEMIPFYAEMEKLYRQRKGVHVDPFADIYYPDNLVKPMNCLEEAKKKVKEGSVFFDKLYEDFKAFHGRALAEKGKIDVSREKELQRIRGLKGGSDTPIKVPFLPAEPAVGATPDLWPGACKLDLSTPSDYQDFQNSAAYVACDSEHLHIGIVAAESKIDKLLAKCQENNKGPMWGDDSFEVMLMPPQSEGYYQIIVNSLGFYRAMARVKQTGKTEDAVDFKVAAKATVAADKWTVTLAIPFSQFGKDAFKQPWRFNIFRNRFCGEAWQASGIRLIVADFHKTDDYCVLTWPEQLATAK